MPGFTRRIRLETGWAEASMSPRNWVRVGDRLMPRRVAVDMPGVDGNPRLQMDLEVLDGRPQCRSVRIESVDGGREIQKLDLRSVEVGRWMEDIFAAFALEVVEESGGEIKAVASFDFDAEIGALGAIQGARKARKITPDLLREVAAVYRANIRGNPTQAIADRFGVSHRQASNYRKRAEEAGLLPPTTRGKKRAD